MPINTTKLGPGTLTLGAGAAEFNAQVTSCKITPSENVETTDSIKVLSGEVLDGDSSETFSYVLEGSFLQDLGAVAGVVAWSWANKGTEQPFVFTPNTAAGVSVEGVLKPVPLGIGGDEVDAGPMSSDFSWRCVGEPDLT